VWGERSPEGNLGAFVSVSQGRIVEYIDQGNFLTAYCLQDEGSRLHLLTPSNREVNLSPKRALLISSATFHFGSREELLNRLKLTEERRTMLKEKIQVRELWELVKDENQSLDREYLAQICFSEKVTDDHISALMRALFDDKIHFKMKDGRFLPNSGEKIEQMMNHMEEEALKEEMLEAGGAWLRRIMETKPAEEPTCKEQVHAILIDLALYGEDAPSLKLGKDLLQRAGITDISEARKILVKLGVWEEDENLDLFRFHIRTSFSEEQVAESERLSLEEIELGEREDLRNLSILTVDGPLTRDFDDALSMEISDDALHLGIHIADVASVIPPEDILDKEAAERASSLYLPRQQIPMLPPKLSQEKLSLKQGCDRPAISLLSRLDREGNVLDFRFVPSLVRVQRQLTYDHVNEVYEQDVLLGDMCHLAKKLRQKRVERGALLLSLPEVFIQVNPDSSVSIGLADQDTPSRMMVAEFMILYNWLAARVCKEAQVPVLYRSQEDPTEILTPGETGHIYYVFKQRRKINPLVIDTQPKPHSGLGVDVYTNVSSPIRRYFDLVMQRQMAGLLFNKSLTYTRDDLENLRMMVDPVLRHLEVLKRSRTRYWIQKYFLQHTGERFPALVLDVMKNRYRLLLTDFLFVVEMKKENGRNFSEGQNITVRVKKSDPWNDLLKVEAD
jgi:exoribonuclease-2